MRELADALEYTQWRNFDKVIERAMIVCENSGHDMFDDFAEVSKNWGNAAGGYAQIREKYSRD